MRNENGIDGSSEYEQGFNDGYERGYQNGKDKMVFEILNGYGGDAGSTTRELAARWVRDAAYGAARQILGLPDDAPTALSDIMDGAENNYSVQAALADGYPATAIRRATGIAVAAALRMRDNLAAQRRGDADAFGLDAAARQRAWTGRYDGAV